MGTDMTMLYEYKKRSGEWCPIKEDGYLERDYNMFYALMGRVGYGDPMFPPISQPKGFPNDMSLKWNNDKKLKDIIEYEKSGKGHNCISFITLKELIDSRFYRKTSFKGWTWEDSYKEWLKSDCSSNLYVAPVNTPKYDREGLVLRDVYDYPNVTLVDRIIEPMRQMKQEYNLDSDSDIRVIFWLY